MENLRQTRSRIGLWATASLISVLSALPALAEGKDWQTLDADLMPQMVTPVGHMIKDLYHLITYITIGIFILVMCLMGYVMVRFRKRPGENRQPMNFNHHTGLEILWTALPAAILIGIAIPTYHVIAYQESIPQDPDGLNVEVIGHQWYWEYRLPDHKVQIMANDGNKTPLVVPVGKVIRLNLTAEDVIHSWFVPQFGFKIDSVPGRINQAWFKVEKPGLYHGQCAELCGTMHAKMYISVKAVSDADWEIWRKGQPIASLTQGDKDTKNLPVDLATLQKEGEKVYGARCASCHQPTGEGIAGAFPPLVGAEQVTGKPEEHIKIVLNGLNGAIKVKGQSYNGVMPAWKDVLSDREIAAVLTYERNAWGNKAGVVTPDQVAKER
ncbi:MAG: cytochrome c oxidase subunit II [Candidatus Sericytochromatia bacterium]|nr:cytochrome c oxidase subunit II [Candidatus Sericytochromatia bacterium]